MQARKFAVFDIDGTLIRWQLFHAIVHHLGKHGFVNPDDHNSIKQARLNWKNRHSQFGFNEYEKTLVDMYITALPNICPKDYEIIVQEVFDQYKDQVFVYTRDLLKSLNKQGYFTIAISGSQNDVVQKLANYHGFDYAVGAELEIIKGKYTGIIKTPIFDKGSLLKELVQKFKLSYKDSFGVGDSASDIALLQEVQNPIAFNPNYELYQQSIKQQWTIVVERKNVTYELKSQNGQYYLTGSNE